MNDYLTQELSKTQEGSIILIIVALLVLAVTIGKKVVTVAIEVYKRLKIFILDQHEEEEEKQNTSEKIQELSVDLKEVRDDLKTVTKALSALTDQINEEKKEREALKGRLVKVEDNVSDMSKSTEATNKQVLELLNDHHDEIKLISEKVSEISQSIPMLIESDVESFRAYLIETYERCKLTNSINIYTLQTLSKRFENYRREGGNTWAEALIGEIKSFEHTTISFLDEHYTPHDHDNQ